MFSDLQEFVDALLLRTGSISMVTYDDRAGLFVFSGRLQRELVAAFDTESVNVKKIDAQIFGSSQFVEQLADVTEICAPNVILLLSGIEPLLPSSAITLNGFRERLRRLRASIILIRKDRFIYFQSQSPDLMCLVGTMIVHAEQIGPPLSKADIEDTLRAYEQASGITNRDFYDKWERSMIPDTWENMLRADICAAALREGITL